MFIINIIACFQGRNWILLYCKETTAKKKHLIFLALDPLHTGITKFVEMLSHIKTNNVQFIISKTSTVIVFQI